MGEIMFNYTVDNTPLKHEIMFKYWYNMSKEQSFSYQRFVALFDARTFNKPVAITKVATGLIDLHQLFVIQDGHSMLLQSQNWINIRSSFEPILSSDVFGQNINHLASIPLDDSSNISFKPIPGITDLERTTFGQNINNLARTPLDDSSSIATRPRVGMNSFERILFGNYGDITINYERILFGKTYDMITNAKQHMFGEKEWKMSIWKHDCMGSDEEITVNYEHQNMMMYTDRISLTPLPMYIGTPFNNTTNFFNNKEPNSIKVPTIRPTNFIVDSFANKIREADVNFYENIYGISYGKISNFNHDFNVYVKEQDVVINRNSHIFRPIPYTNLFEYFYASYDDKILYKFKHINLSKDILKAGYGKNISTSKDILKGYKDSEDSASKDNMKAKITKNFFLYTDDINTSVSPELLVFTFGKTSGYLSLDSFGITPNRVLNITTSNVSASDGGNPTQDVPGWLGSQYGGKALSSIKYTLVQDNGRKIFRPDLLDGVYDNGRSGDFIPYIVSALDNGKELNRFTFKDLRAYKANNDFKVIPASFFVIKNSNKISLYSEKVIQIHKIANNIDIYEELFKSVWTHKESHKMHLGLQANWYYKVKKDIRNTLDGIFVNKESHPFWMHDSGTNVNQVPKDIAIFQHGASVIKKHVLLSVDNNIDMVIKTALDVDFYGVSGYDTLIIPISKIRKQSFIDRIDEMVNKLSKPVFITSQTFASAIPKPVGFPNLDLFFDKESHDVFVQYKNTFITKSKVHSAITDSEFISKIAKNINIYSDSFIVKLPVDAWIDDSLTFGKKIKKNVFITDKEISTLKLPHIVSLYNDAFMDKLPELCYYTYGSLIKKEKHDIIAEQHNLLHKINHDINVMDMSAAIRPIREFYYNQVCHAEVFRNGGNPLYNQLDAIYRTYRETKILPNDFGNWAWVHEDPDALGDAYNIDELLLPEVDTRYEDFEDIIFDKKTLRPKNPVKKIDDTTFVCKYPIKHPLPRYSKTGIVYLDVRAEIMHEIFLKFYRIWQSKLFEFSMMTMTQSVTKMLEYIYSWIMLYYPQDRVEEALRVFRQIRWYGEMAIIQNSQYIVSYEYDDLKSNLHTGTCSIPNDIDPDENGNIANPTMIVDSQNAVIRNNPDLIGISDARVQFKVNVKKNTTFSFSLINTVGSVNIYIDDVLVDTLSTSKLNLTYTLNYTGKPIKIDIIKTRQNNLNNMFCIGNIIVAKGTFKELSIEFDPVLRAGNQPLDEMAKKMIQYANEHDDITDAYEHILKANVGVSEMYKRMVEYWEIHHQDKKKGKRLTIKQA